MIKIFYNMYKKASRLNVDLAGYIHGFYTDLLGFNGE
jgi:hypothetical protein